MKSPGSVLKLGPRCPYCADQPLRRVVITAPRRKWYIPGERRHHCGNCGTRVRCVNGQVAYWAWFWVPPALGLTGALKALRMSVGDYAFYALLVVWAAGCLFLWSRIRWEKYFHNDRGIDPASMPSTQSNPDG